MPEYIRSRRAEVQQATKFDQEAAIASQRAFKEDLNPKDVPPPIVYDDEFGHTVVGFSKVGAVNGVKAYDIIYQHNDGKLYSLSKFLDRNFFFHWTTNAKFATVAQDGTPAVFVDYDALSFSRNNLLSLGHEMGHTHQRQVDLDLWKILGTEVTPRMVDRLTRKYPSLATHIEDMVRIRMMSDTDDIARKGKLVRGIVHKSNDGFQASGIDSSLPQFADTLQRVSTYDAPLGPTHLYTEFVGPQFKLTLPGVYVITNAAAEQRAWEHALDLEAEGILHPGFRTPEQRLQHMQRALSTYDKDSNSNAYTLWLRQSQNSR